MNGISRRNLLGLAGAAVAAAFIPALTRAAGRTRPNIVFFLMDDMGWMDSTPYGSKYYETPNMERLARQGMRFTDAYAASPLCSPTRSSIMSGKYPARTGITTPCCHIPEPANWSLYPGKAAPDCRVVCPNSRHYLKPDEYTIAEALSDAGYVTGHVGKWHLGINEEHWPEKQGFAHAVHGKPDPGPRSYFSPYQFKSGTIKDGPEGEYITDRLTSEAISFMEANKDRPFYLNLWHHSVHGPWGHKLEITESFTGKKDPLGRQGNPIMASMLKSADESLGRVLDSIERLGIADRTIVIFFSDNGGNTRSNSQVDSQTKNLKEGHPAYARLMDWRKYAGSQPPTNNSPLRDGKASCYEGGVREPMMVSWPGVVKPGSVSSAVVSSIDFYPTILEMTGVQPKQKQLLDGVSIVPALTGSGLLKREAIFCHFPHKLQQPPCTSVRRGDWKLLRFYDTGKDNPDKYELYNLKDDIGETTNLAGKNPELVRELDALIDGFVKDTGAVLPRPNPAYKPLVNGWQGLGASAVTSRENTVVLTSSEGRTQMQNMDVDVEGNDLKFSVMLRSSKGGGGILYWSTAKESGFVRERRTECKPVWDGEWHELDIPFKAEGRLNGLRFDASLTPASIEIRWIKLSGPAGTILKVWEFGETAGGKKQ